MGTAYGEGITTMKNSQWDKENYGLSGGTMKVSIDNIAAGTKEKQDEKTMRKENVTCTSNPGPPFPAPTTPPDSPAHIRPDTVEEESRPETPPEES